MRRKDKIEREMREVTKRMGRRMEAVIRFCFNGKLTEKQVWVWYLHAQRMVNRTETHIPTAATLRMKTVELRTKPLGVSKNTVAIDFERITGPLTRRSR